MALATLQVINLQRHGFSIFLLREVDTTPRMTLACTVSVHASFPVFPLLKITEVISTLKAHGFCLVWT